MSVLPDQKILETLIANNIPRGINLDVDKEELRKNLMECGLEKRFVQNLIEVLGAGMTLDVDWEFLDDYDREETQSRITRRTMLKPEVVSEILNVIYTAYETKTSESFEYLEFDYYDEGLVITWCDRSVVSVDIPSRMMFNDELFEITRIENCAFVGCTSLTSVIIPDSVTEIGNNAFWGCTSLTSVIIPDSVTKIGNCAFWGCTSLKSIEISSDNECYKSLNGILYNKEMNEIIRCPPGRQSEEFTIPDSVTKIGDFAFRDCTSLTSIIIPDSVTEIGYCAFEGCTSLTSIIIPDSVTEIVYRAFEGCTSLDEDTKEMIRRIDPGAL